MGVARDDSRPDRRGLPDAQVIQKHPTPKSKIAGGLARTAAGQLESGHDSDRDTTLALRLPEALEVEKTAQDRVRDGAPLLRGHWQDQMPETLTRREVQDVACNAPFRITHSP